MRIVHQDGASVTMSAEAQVRFLAYTEAERCALPRPARPRGVRMCLHKLLAENVYEPCTPVRVP